MNALPSGAAPCHAYLFEAKGIQRWILDGGRLRDIVAASHLLAATCRSDENDLLAAVLQAAAFPASCSRRAGGTFMLHFNADGRDGFHRFRTLWHLVFRQVAPGLEFVESQGSGTTHAQALDAAYDTLRQVRPRAGRDNGLAGVLPLGHPLVSFAARTGRPAVRRDEDLVTRAKRRQDGAGDALAGKFLPDASLLWPTQMDEPEPGEDGIRFPFDDEDRWIAVLHADISALGRFYAVVGTAAKTATTDPIQIARQASAAIEQAVTDAARFATRQVLVPIAARTPGRVMPARPIVLGGDDVTIILRGDVALPFAQVFLEQLEIASTDHLQAFARDHLGGSPLVTGPLTAAAGVAFGKAKQPFFRLLNLAEDLCGHAKGAAKKAAGGQRPASVISFLRMTESALASDASALFDRLAVPPGRKLTAQPYRVGQIAATGFADLADLGDLRASLSTELRPGRLREIRSLWQQGLTARAEEDWRRWLALARRRSEGEMARFAAALARTTKAASTSPPEVFAAASIGGPLAGGAPLFDALEWNAIHHAPQATEAT